MNQQIFLKSLNLVTVILATEIFSVSFFQPAWANLASDLPLTLEKTLIHSSPIQKDNFDPPPSDGDPKGTSGGGSRNGNLCVLDPQSSQKFVTPLVATNLYGLILSNHKVSAPATYSTLLSELPKTSAKICV